MKGPIPIFSAHIECKRSNRRLKINQEALKHFIGFTILTLSILYLICAWNKGINCLMNIYLDCWHFLFYHVKLDLCVFTRISFLFMVVQSLYMCIQSNLSIMVTQGTGQKLTTIDRWPLYPGLVNYLYVWPICLCMIDIYRGYERCSPQNIVLFLMHKHDRNKLVNNI